MYIDNKVNNYSAMTSLFVQEMDILEVQLLVIPAHVASFIYNYRYIGNGNVQVSLQLQSNKNK